MASRGLGSLTLDLIAKIGGFVGPLTQAERELDRRTKRMNKMARDFGHSFGSAIRSAAGSFLAFAGVGLSIGGAVAAMKSAIDNADKLRDASIRLGVGTEVLSKWGYAAKQTGTDLESLERGLKLLSRSATEALDPKTRKAGLFNALGVSRDALTDLNTLVPQVADAFKRMEDGPQKAAVAMELFGKSGADLIEFLNQGQSGLDEFGEKARRLGIVISQDTADKADDFNDKLGDLKASFGGLSSQIAAELLPDLNRLLGWMVDFVSDGGNAKRVTDGIRDSMEGLGRAASDVYSLVSALQGLQSELARAAAASVDLVNKLPGAEAAQGFREWAAKHPLLGAVSPLVGAAATLERLRKQGAGSDFADVVAGFSTRQRLGRFADPAYESASLNFNPNGNQKSALDAYFAGSGSKPKLSRSGGKSEAQRDAERLKAAFDGMNASLAEQIALHGKTGETAKERYELEFGGLAKLDPALKQILRDKLDIRDAQVAETEAYEQSLQLAKEREEATNRGIESIDRLLKDMEFENELLRMNNAERQIAVMTRGLDADAMVAQAENLKRLMGEVTKNEQLREQVGLMDEWRDSVRGFFSDVAHGANAWDSAKRALDRFGDALFDLASKKLVEQLFGSYGSQGGGNWIGAFVSAIFGGGKASGGTAMPNTMYEVNERGFEMASVGGRDYMLTGSRPVEITPHHMLGGGSVNVTQQFINPRLYDRRSDTQRQAESAQRLRQAVKFA